MRRIAAAVMLIPFLLRPVETWGQQRSRPEAIEVSVKNFPSVQNVVIEKALATLDVRETDLTRAYTNELDIGTGERRPLGPFPLDGRRRAQIQITQSVPKTGVPALVTVKWYVRFNPEDAFFDPCRTESNTTLCATGFPPVGAKLRPLLPANQGEPLETGVVLILINSPRGQPSAAGAR